MHESRGDRHRLIGCFLVAAMLMLPVLAFGQSEAERLSPTTLSADPPTEQQVQEIETFVSKWMNVLRTGSSPQEIARARQLLLDPIRSNLTSAGSRAAMVDAISAALGKAGDIKNAAIKLNVLIVGSELPNGAVVDLAIPALADSNAAVRYWAAKALAEVAEQAGAAQAFSEDQQRKILSGLKAAMAHESSDVTLEQMAAAMAGLSIPEAQRELVNVISQRVALFLSTPNEGVRIDRQALGDLQSRLAIREANGQDITETTRQLLIVTAQYAHAVAKALQEDRVPAAVRPHAIAMMQTVDEIFGFALTRLDSQLTPGPRLAEPAQSGQFPLLLLNVLEWVGTPDNPGVLNRGRVNIPASELQLPAAAPAPAESAPATPNPAAPAAPAPAPAAAE